MGEKNINSSRNSGWIVKYTNQWWYVDKVIQWGNEKEQ